MPNEGCTSSQFFVPSQHVVPTLTNPPRSQFGDLTNGCNSTALHWNPRNVTHGGGKDDEGHAGDFGNIQADSYGVASIDIWSTKIRLDGPFSVLGLVLSISSRVRGF
jgi:Cu/Zn superoxide dismutase